MTKETITELRRDWMSNRSNMDAFVTGIYIFNPRPQYAYSFYIAMTHLFKSADYGYPEAYLALGILYEQNNGMCVMQKSVEYYKKASDNGSSITSYFLYQLYHFGDGVQKDHKKAVEYLKKSANNGFILALYHLGRLYYNGGVGITKDAKEAAKYYRRAIEIGKTTTDIITPFYIVYDLVKYAAMTNLGVMYYLGDDVEKNYNEAFSLFMKAAQAGFATAQRNIGNCYYNGYGVAVDKTESRKWYKMAADNGEQTAKELLIELNFED